MATVIQGTEVAIPLERPMPQRSRLSETWSRIGWPLGVFVEVVLFLVFWEVIVRQWGWIRVEYISSPTLIYARVVQMLNMNYLQPNIVFSMNNFLIGYALACLVGVPFGLAMGSFRKMDRMLSPFVWTFYSTPRLALAPMIVIWLGFAWQSKVLIVFLGAFFPMVVNAMAGVKTVEPLLISMAQTYGASRLEMYKKVILPYSLPFVLNGLRIGIARALSGMIVGEMIGSAMGLGHIVGRAGAQFDVVTALGATLAVVVMANVAIMLFRYAEARLVPWRVGV